MGEPTSLAERRWEKVTDPAEHSITDMLRVAIGKIERGELDPQHAILCLGKVEDGHTRATFLQAGTFDCFAQLGLVDRVKLLIIGPE